MKSAYLVIWSTTWFTWVPPLTVQMEFTKLTCKCLALLSLGYNLLQKRVDSSQMFKPSPALQMCVHAGPATGLEQSGRMQMVSRETQTQARI